MGDAQARFASAQATMTDARMAYCRAVEIARRRTNSKAGEMAEMKPAVRVALGGSAAYATAELQHRFSQAAQDAYSLLAFDIDAVGEVLERGDRYVLADLIPRLRQWCDEMERVTDETARTRLRAVGE